MLRLKESPIEWIKFTGVMGLSVNLPLAWLAWRGTIPAWVSWVGVAVALVAVGCATIRPHWFRGFYRLGMTISYQLGLVVGRVLLTAVFFLLVTPMGWLLRLCGKDLLQLKARPGTNSYWQPARNNRAFDRMF